MSFIGWLPTLKTKFWLSWFNLSEWYIGLTFHLNIIVISDIFCLFILFKLLRSYLQSTHHFLLLTIEVVLCLKCNIKLLFSIFISFLDQHIIIFPNIFIKLICLPGKIWVNFLWLLLGNSLLTALSWTLFLLFRCFKLYLLQIPCICFILLRTNDSWNLNLFCSKLLFGTAPRSRRP